MEQEMLKRTKPHYEMMMKFLRDRRAASEYLNAAIEEGDSVFLQALREVADANGLPMSQIAADANMSRENLYKMLSEQGNPTLQSLTNVTRVLGLKMKFEPSEAEIRH